MVDELVAVAIGGDLTPAEASELALKQFEGEPPSLGADVAAKVRRGVWAERLRRADEEQFAQMAGGIEGLSPQALDREMLCELLDAELDRRGLPPSPARFAEKLAQAERLRATLESTPWPTDESVRKRVAEIMAEEAGADEATSPEGSERKIRRRRPRP